MNEAAAASTPELRGAGVLVLGLGDSGLGMAAWCARAGADVRVWDSRDNAPQEAALAQRVPGALRLRGELTPASLVGVSLVLKSPGLAPHDARIAALLKHAVEAGVPVRGELDLFIAALRGLEAERGYAPKLVAITGTNGKTTTTAMAALLIERAGRRVALAGNIGPTLLDTLAQALDTPDLAREAAPQAVEPAGDGSAPDAADTGDAPGATGAAGQADASALPEVWVLELSSFQLDGVQGFAPHATAVLNLTEDHLDWHGSMAAYTEAKSRIFGPHTTLVLNRDDARVAALAPAPAVAAPAPRGRGKAKPVDPPRDVVWFGLDAPRHAGDFGLVVENDMAWLVRAQAIDDTPRRAAADADDVILQRLMPADALRVRGRHNAANALAALALASAIGCPLAPMLHGLREYRGEAHRVEHLGSIDGVDAFDDSKGTNVGATVAALNGLGADKAPAKLVVILGGDGKGQDFAPLREPVQRFVRAVATLGRDAERIETALAGFDGRIERHASLEAATRWCFARALPGDAVLLSPACASLDMFRNYAHRAEVFAAEVNAIATERGGLAA
jgi:UDP-N-acetylmuramoylalanine--D-glutamate ligase